MLTVLKCNKNEMCPIQWIIGFVLLVVTILGLVMVIGRCIVESECYKNVLIYFQSCGILKMNLYTYTSDFLSLEKLTYFLQP